MIHRDIKKVIVYKELEHTESSLKTVVPIQNNSVHFCDILEKCNNNVAKLRIYTPDGNIVTGYVYTKPFTMVDIFNSHLLYDGRFNVV